MYTVCQFIQQKNKFREKDNEILCEWLKSYLSTKMWKKETHPFSLLSTFKKDEQMKLNPPLYQMHDWNIRSGNIRETTKR